MRIGKFLMLLSFILPIVGVSILVSSGIEDWLVRWIVSILMVIVILQMIYTIRHYIFTIHRLFFNQASLYSAVYDGKWPSVTVFIAAHNEEAVIAGCIESLLKCEYPADKIVIMPVNDRSTDGTKEIIDLYAAQDSRIQPFHRVGGKAGKAAALADATDIVLKAGKSDLIIVFDADYLPSRRLLKQLIAPFFDPEVGAVMGRVVPQNAGVNLLTRLLDLERSGGYQVDQQARYNLGAVAQYGGTVGGVRLGALEQAGGWTPDVLAEDTDLTYRLLLNGWQTAYLAYAECYEEVPQSWAVRFRQISRWAKGHDQVAGRYFGQMFDRRGLRWMERWDGIALLGVFLMAPILMLGLLLTVVLLVFGQGASVPANMAVLLLLLTSSFACLGNFAAFFEVAGAVHLDGHRQRIRLLPLLLLGFLVSLVAISKAGLDWLILDRAFKREFVWDKTARYRAGAAIQKPNAKA